MDAVSDSRLAQINPELAGKVRSLAALLADENIIIRVTQGLRSWNEQQALYAQGRTTPGKIVTNAPPGYSWHQFGLAVDVAPFNLEGQPDWNAEDPNWKRIIALGESLGLVSGSTFISCPDDPHFQLTGSWPVSPTDEVRSVFLNAGMLAVWVEAGLSTGVTPS
jgi:peptidoglycan L-alanyl-D-glutamate endopeptidase CwlK